MASFWENFAEAMGWGKANHTQHLSDTSEDRRQSYRDRYADSVRKNSQSNPGLKISNAKNDPNDFWHGNSNPNQVFSPEWTHDSNTNTELLDFTVSRPTDPNNIDSSRTKSLHGKVLARVPKESVGAKNGRYFTPGGGVYHKDASGVMGVYEAVLDDGTVLDASAFEDLLRNENYGHRFLWGDYVARDRKSKSRKKVNDDIMKEYLDYRDKVKFSYDQSPGKNVVWDKNWRRWGAR